MNIEVFSGREFFRTQSRRLGLTMGELSRKARVPKWKIDAFSCGRIRFSAFSAVEQKQLSRILDLSIRTLRMPDFIENLVQDLAKRTSEKLTDIVKSATYNPRRNK